MRLATISLLAVLAATPAFAQVASDSDANTSSPTAVTPPTENPNVDPQTATTDAARQDMYQHKADAAKAQSKVDSAKADRDAELAKAQEAHDAKNAAQGDPQ